MTVLPTLHTERLILRLFTPADASSLAPDGIVRIDPPTRPGS